MTNPYFQKSFFSFFFLLFSRLVCFLSFQGDGVLAPDELQILVFSGISISSAFVGSFLLLRKMTMLANCLSHTILFGIALVFLLGPSFGFDFQFSDFPIFAMLVAAVLSAVLSAFFTSFLQTHAKLEHDSSIALTFNLFFALGVILISVFLRSSHIAMDAVMGNADILSFADLQLVFAVMLINCLLMLLFFKEYELSSFDPCMAKSMGLPQSFLNYLLTFQLAITVVAAFRAVGVLLVLAFLLIPPLSARLFVSRLRPMIALAMLIGIFCSCIAVAFGRHLLSAHQIALPSASLLACVMALFYVLSLCLVNSLRKPKQVKE